MKQNFDASDERLSGLLKMSRPVGELPPGFQDRVWQRIEKFEQKPESSLDRFASWLMIPRVAFGALAAIILVAATFGAVRGASAGATEARDRYVASVDPSRVPH